MRETATANIARAYCMDINTAHSLPDLPDELIRKIILQLPLSKMIMLFFYNGCTTFSKFFPDDAILSIATMIS